MCNPYLLTLTSQRLLLQLYGRMAIEASVGGTLLLLESLALILRLSLRLGLLPLLRHLRRHPEIKINKTIGSLLGGPNTMINGHAAK